MGPPSRVWQWLQLVKLRAVRKLLPQPRWTRLKPPLLTKIAAKIQHQPWRLKHKLSPSGKLSPTPQVISRSATSLWKSLKMIQIHSDSSATSVWISPRLSQSYWVSQGIAKVERYHLSYKPEKVWEMHQKDSKFICHEQKRLVQIDHHLIECYKVVLHSIELRFWMAHRYQARNHSSRRLSTRRCILNK